MAMHWAPSVEGLYGKLTEAGLLTVAKEAKAKLSIVVGDVAPDLAVEFDANGHDAGYVAAGIGISITDNVIAAEYEAFGLDIRPFEPTAVYHYVVSWRKGRQLSTTTQLIVEQLVNSFRVACPT
jgi:DNA-binding transcriptional LysR family regulator